MRVNHVGAPLFPFDHFAERLGEGGEVGAQRLLLEVAMVCGRDPADRHLRRDDLLRLRVDGIEPFVGEAACDDRHRIDIGAQRLMACRIEDIGDMATGICRHAEIDGRRLQTTAERQMYDDHERPFSLYRGSTTVWSICIQRETREILFSATTYWFRHTLCFSYRRRSIRFLPHSDRGRRATIDPLLSYRGIRLQERQSSGPKLRQNGELNARSARR